MQTTQLLTTTFETTSPLTETQTAPLENVVESMGEEVHHASRVLNAVLTPIKNAIPSLIMAIIFAFIGYALIKYLLRLVSHGLKRSNLDRIAVGFIRSVIQIICNFSSHRAFYLECANGFDCGSDCLRRGCRCTGIER